MTFIFQMKVMSKLKILFVIDHYRGPHAGTENQLNRLVKGLIQNGHEVHLLVFSPSDYVGAGHFPCPVTVLGHVSLSSLGMWKALWAQARQFRAQGFRLAHVFFNDPSLICPPVFAANGIKTIISRRDMGYWYTPVYKWWLRINSALVSAAIVNSEAVSVVTQQEEWIPARKMHVIYNGYDMPPGEAGAVPAEIVDWHQSDALIAIIVANIRPIKRIQDAVEAVGVLKARVPALRLVVIGDGDASALVERAGQLGVQDRVRFLGRRSNPVDYIRVADIGMLCSESEGLSNSIIEYLHCGKPVVCSRVGGNPELVAHGETGLCYSAGNVQELASSLEFVCTDTGLRQTMSANALAGVESRFSVTSMVRRHEEIYAELLGES